MEHPSQPFQSPPSVTKRYSAPRNSASSTRPVEYITDSEEDEIPSTELSDLGDGEARAAEQGDEDYVEDPKDDETDAEPATPTPLAALPDSSAKPLLSVPEDHPEDLTYATEADVNTTKQTTNNDRVKPSSNPPATKAKHAQKDGIRCVCPTRFMKARTRLGICLECGIIHHYACQARSRAGVRSFMCLTCPGGMLEDAADHITGAKSSRKSTSAQHNSKAQPAHKVVKAAPKAKTQDVAKASVVHRLHTGAEKIDDVFDETPREASPRRHDLRQKAVPIMRDRPTRAARKSQPATDPISTQFDKLYTGLMRKSKQVQEKVRKDPRISNLHDLFLHSIPTKVLWGHYCVLPEGVSTNAAVLRATEVHLLGYHVEPINAVPESWSKELKYRLGLLLDAATIDGQKIHLSPKQWELNAGMALRHVRDIAMEVLHHGSYKGKRARFGLLGEVLGLSEKGTFWKGGDVFVGNAVTQ